MLILDIAIILFIILEGANVAILYFKPTTKLGNGVGVFKAFRKAQEDNDESLFTRYLVNWIANAKVIFILLLAVILFTGSETTKLWACIAMFLSIMLYYITLHPIIKKLDNNSQINPKGYSKTLFGMISAFVAVFGVAITLFFIL